MRDFLNARMVKYNGMDAEERHAHRYDDEYNIAHNAHYMRLQLWNRLNCGGAVPDWVKGWSSQKEFPKHPTVEEVIECLALSEWCFFDVMLMEEGADEDPARDRILYTEVRQALSELGEFDANGRWHMDKFKVLEKPDPISGAYMDDATKKQLHVAMGVGDNPQLSPEAQKSLEKQAYEIADRVADEKRAELEKEFARRKWDIRIACMIGGLGVAYAIWKMFLA